MKLPKQENNSKLEEPFTENEVELNMPDSIVKDEAAEILQHDDNSIEENEDKLFKVPCQMCLQEIFQSELEVHILSCSYQIKIISAALKAIALILVMVGNSHSPMQSSEFQRQYLDEFDLICLLQGLMIFVNN